MKLTIGLGALIFSMIAGAVPVCAYGQDICQRIPPELAWMTRPNTVEGSRAYIYRTVSDTDLRLHVFFPVPNKLHLPDKRPAIVFFFGGGWTWGSVEEFVPQAKYLAQRGMVAAVADFRVLCRDRSTPFDSVEDAREAIRWIRSHAAELDIDPSRIVASGESSGAQMALSSAFIDDPIGRHQISAKPDALILFSPAIDLANADDKASVSKRFGDLVADRIDTISPLQHVREGLPPTIILTGKADDSTPYSIAEAYCKRAVASGNQCRVVGYDGAGHGFVNSAVENSKGGKWLQPTLLDVDRFLTNIGYLKGPTPSGIPKLESYTGR